MGAPHSARPSAGVRPIRCTVERRGEEAIAGRAIMVLGTASHVGKSLLAAALCRIFAQQRLPRGPIQSTEHVAQFGRYFSRCLRHERRSRCIDNTDRKAVHERERL
jgi:hypothetical protein